MAVFIKKVNIPQKSDLINIDMTGSGTAQTYRIIKKISDDVVEVVAMTDASTSQSFGNNNTYENGSLDTYLNTTWYNTLSNTAKLAIVDKSFKQESWDINNTSGAIVTYNGVDSSSGYTISLINTSFGSEITRHCYTIGVQDIIDYLEVTPEMLFGDTTLTAENVWTMFWNSTSTHSGIIWLRSAYASNVSFAFAVYGSSGKMNSRGSGTDNSVRPAFQIDLSKIDYTFTDGRQPVELKPVSILQKSNNTLSRVGMSYKEPPIDLTGTTWLFNNSLTIPAGVGMFNLTYTTTGTPYHTSWANMLIGYNTSDVATSDFLVYQDGGYKSAVYLVVYGGWVDNTYKTITITGGTDATNQDLVAWLQANATQQ